MLDIFNKSPFRVISFASKGAFIVIFFLAFKVKESFAWIAFWVWILPVLLFIFKEFETAFCSVISPFAFMLSESWAKT